MERRERNCSKREFIMPDRNNTDRRRRGGNALLSYANEPGPSQTNPIVQRLSDLVENLMVGRNDNGLYYRFCVCIVRKFFDDRTHRTVETARNLFDKLIDTEFALFNRSRVLDFLIGFLIHRSDLSPNNLIYGSCLDYVLCKRDRLMNN
ncbi:ORF135 [Leucania separata nucleopolyhedrovirus]|uniref:ORF135 n=1 Tax=Leucania separata nucleopolyhedrovirus TaxID=1307956 RepID=Q0IKY4_NPVLS|nr:ORF135 [Leucania separata nucleopolyhedrovirus]AAR28899.1 ORF135 [Leucania separata nucleopolyhedrovirus]